MKILNKKLLYDFMAEYSDVQSQLESWMAEVEAAEWDTPHHLKGRYRKASVVNNNQVVFDFCWNKYRLWAQVSYQNKIVLARKIGTHREYDKWKIG